MEMNEVLEKLPKHLMGLVIDQPYNSYTAQDHALWRYVMRQNVDYLSKVAHKDYVPGLKATGIGIERIPEMYGMNRILKEIGWAAVAVDGFIPPAAFMEFQAYNVLVIAADIRPMDQIEYTPAPDIIHESAGHAPMIANPEYSKYLVEFGRLGAKAFSSAMDYRQYEAIRHLSILKADPYTKKEEIDKAVEELENINNNLGAPSEMSLIRNLHWWTVEYGLIGDVDNPKIYGAGLLSSIGESYYCLQDKVKKLPYTIDAVNYSFDITEPQPQLFVTPDFKHLNTVLDEFADRMAIRRGGKYGIEKAIESENTATAVYSSGLQVSGTFMEQKVRNEEPVYIQTSGPTALSIDGRQLPGHGKDYHKDGFSSPVGKLKDSDKPLEDMTDGDLASLGIEMNKKCYLDFRSGVKVEGILSDLIRKNGKIILMTFKDCTVTYDGETMFRPSWGNYDMAAGEKIVSVYSGPADAEAFGWDFKAPTEKTHKIQHNEVSKRLHSMYEEVREIRESKCGYVKLKTIFDDVKKEYPKEWLLPLEILELVIKNDINTDLEDEIRAHLDILRNSHDEFKKLIDDGMKLIDVTVPMAEVTTDSQGKQG